MIMSTKTTFWQFIQEHTIEIPIIQRDFAQGRIGKESLRKGFLADLRESLDNKSEMKLDFVYGSTEQENKKKKLFPLDGQQRLTTLWLLHWYIALRANKFSDLSKLNNFTYETRISSREFCEKLCNSENFKSFEGNDIVNYIENQTWFYSAWKQDPTIQSMLRMLGGEKWNLKKKKEQQNQEIVDGIEKLFKDVSDKEEFVKYWDLLISNECPIVFYYLPLTDFGLSDDLYIKMNARGKQLTSFENFKADLIGYITNQAKNEKITDDAKKEWADLLDPEGGIPIKLDTDWTNIFWENRSKTNKIDEIYFAFFNRIFWNFLFVDNENGKYTLQVGEGKLSNGEKTSTIEMENASYRMLNEDRYDNYTSFDAFQYKKNGDIYEIPLEFFQNIQIILNRYCQFKEEIPKCKWNTDFYFIPIYKIDNKNENIYHENENKEQILDISNITQIYRIVFFAICKYFLENPSPCKDTLKPWLRVVWNLVSGEDADGRPLIRTTLAVQSAINDIDKLDSPSVYQSLIKNGKTSSSSDFSKRWNEEVEKASQIINGIQRNDRKTWEEVIIEAENYGFFHGTIRFLYLNDKGKPDWTDFDIKYGNAQKLQNTGLIELAKYCSDEQIKSIWSKYSFNTKNWKPILLEEKILEPIHNFLMGNPPSPQSVLCRDIENILAGIKNTDVSLLSDWKECGLVLTNYSYRMPDPSNGYVYEVGNEIRNKLCNAIHELEKQGILEVSVPNAWGPESIKIENQVYYRGLWIGMKYKEHYFRYFGDNKIYLMTNNWENISRDGNNKPICANVKDDNINDLKSTLEKLI